jgi:lipopolysaccharide transport system permease protein
VSQSTAQVAGAPLAKPVPALRRVIEPRQPGLRERALEFWRYRRVMPYFGRRMLKKRYQRTWLGWIWIPLRPTFAIASRVFVFGTVLGVAAGGAPYLLFLIIGMSAWGLFASSAYWATRSLELHRGFLKRIYIPRLTILTAAIVPASVEYAVYVVIAVITFVYYEIATGHLYLNVSPELLFAPLGILLMLVLALAIGLWTSVYGAQARDVRFGLNYVLGFWIFLTPVFYPLSTVPQGARQALLFNPMTAPIQLVQDGFLGTGGPPALALFVSLGTVAIVAGGGLWFFNRSEALALDYV